MRVPEAERPLHVVRARSEGVDLRHRICAIMDKHGLTQGHVASLLEIHPGTFSAYMTGRNRRMRPDAMARLARLVESLEQPENLYHFPLEHSADDELQDDPSPKKGRVAPQSSSQIEPNSSEQDALLDGFHRDMIRQRMREEILVALGVNDPMFKTCLQVMTDAALLKYYGVCLAWGNMGPSPE